MTATPPITMTPAPTSPDRADRATFAARAVSLDDFRKNTNIPETQAAIDNVYANAVDAYISAAAAAGSAAAAGAAIWVSGTTYAIGDARYSPADLQTYRRKTAGAGTTDPSLDGTNWARVNLGANSIVRSARTGNTMLAESDRSTLVDVTSGTFSQTFDAAATLTAGWFVWYRNSGTGTVTLDPNGAELIDGAATLALPPGYTAMVTCSGAGFTTILFSPQPGDHEVTVTSGNGYGSTNTVIRRYTTTQRSAGSHITYADSAAAGASFTIAAGGAGFYCIRMVDAHSSTDSRYGASVNSTQLTTGIESITAAKRLFSVRHATGNYLNNTVVVRLEAGDVVRPHVGSNPPNTTSLFESLFSIKKIGA